MTDENGVDEFVMPFPIKMSDSMIRLSVFSQ